jgi:hypothetical protein
MLVSKEEEIDKLKGRNPSVSNGVDKKRSYIDLDSTTDV